MITKSVRNLLVVISLYIMCMNEENTSKNYSLKSFSYLFFWRYFPRPLIQGVYFLPLDFGNQVGNGMVKVLIKRSKVVED